MLFKKEEWARALKTRRNKGARIPREFVCKYCSKYVVVLSEFDLREQFCSEECMESYQKVEKMINQEKFRSHYKKKR